MLYLRSSLCLHMEELAAKKWFWVIAISRYSGVYLHLYKACENICAGSKSTIKTHRHWYKYEIQILLFKPQTLQNLSLTFYLPNYSLLYSCFAAFPISLSPGYPKSLEQPPKEETLYNHRII